MLAIQPKLMVLEPGLLHMSCNTISITTVVNLKSIKPDLWDQNLMVLEVARNL